ncbi:MAG: response regulator [Rhodocyclaceae bacterium]|jgi:CheY-like chemotaxis protein|nr:response regulator [Rhodocyclaceae bacterium]
MMTAPDALRTPLKVLLVEDEEADANLVRLAFDEGHVLVEVHHVLDGVEAFAFLRREPPYPDAPTPDLILLDLNMPRMDGRQFLQKIKQTDPFMRIPVVVLTTSDAETDMVASYCSGAAGFIVKPMDVNDFIDKVKGLGNYWITVVKLPDND